MMKRYEIWMAEIPASKDSHVQSGRRPVIIVSNDLANTHSPVITVVPLTAKMNKPHLPTHVYLRGQGLDRSSLALCEQVMSLDKTRCLHRVGYVYKPYERLALQHALAVQLDMVA